MDSKEMYGRLLGLKSPWTVERVEMDVAHQEVLVFVGHAAGTRFHCPRCQRELAVFDHLAERRWRHLDTCQFMTFLTARPPRIDCPEHGKLQVELPWSEVGSRFTNMFEALAIDVLLAANVKRAAQLLHITCVQEAERPLSAFRTASPIPDMATRARFFGRASNDR
jgi:transposase